MQREPPAILAAYASSVTLLAGVLEANALNQRLPTVALISSAEANRRRHARHNAAGLPRAGLRSLWQHRIA